MFRQCLPAWTSVATASAGLHVAPGEPADPRARRVAAEFGVSLEDHRAQPLTADLIVQVDMIVAMDALVTTEVLTRFPGARSKTVMLGDIADPYDGDETTIHRCYERICAAIRELASAVVWTTEGC